MFEKSKSGPNLCGQKFGQLLVLDRAPSYLWRCKRTNKLSSKANWNCLCDCGIKVIASTTRLNRGKHVRCRTCAYAVRPQSSRRNTAHERVFKRNVISRAKFHKIDISITLEDFKMITEKNCHYCDTPAKDLEVYKNKYAKSETIKYNGLDRIDSNSGYHIDNIVPSCGTCNSMKLDHDIEKFKEHIQKIYKFYIRPT